MICDRQDIWPAGYMSGRIDDRRDEQMIRRIAGNIDAGQKRYLKKRKETKG